MTRKSKLAEIADTACAAVIDLGAAAGDDRVLLEAKCQEIRALLEEFARVPRDLQYRKPRKLREADVALALRETAHAAYAVAVHDCIRALVQRLPAIATSDAQPALDAAVARSSRGPINRRSALLT